MDSQCSGKSSAVVWFRARNILKVRQEICFFLLNVWILRMDIVYFLAFIENFYDLIRSWLQVYGCHYRYWSTMTMCTWKNMVILSRPRPKSYVYSGERIVRNKFCHVCQILMPWYILVGNKFCHMHQILMPYHIHIVEH